MAFGRPSYSSGGKKFTKYVSINEKAPIVGRIIPPIRECAADGIWHAYHAIHWGYKVALKGGEPGKTRFELFGCIQQMDWKTKIVKVECDECSATSRVEDEIKELEVTLSKKGKSEGEIKEFLAPKKGYLKAHNRDAKQYLNFELDSGEVVCLLLSNTTLKDLKKVLADVEKARNWQEGDAILNGLVLEFSCTGHGATGENKRKDYVKPVMVVEEFTDNQGKKRTSKEEKFVAWTDAAAERAEKEGIDLRNPDRFVRISADQIRMLVNGDGDPETNADIFALGGKAERSRERSPERAAVKPIVSAPKADPAPKEEVKAAPVDDEEAELERKLAAKRAAREKAEAEAKKAAEKPPETPKAAPPAAASANDPDEEWLRKIEAGEA